MKIYECMECGNYHPCYGISVIHGSGNMPLGCIGEGKLLLKRDKSVWKESNKSISEIENIPKIPLF